MRLGKDAVESTLAGELLPVAESQGPADVEPVVDDLMILYIEDNVANLRLMESIMELRPTVTLLTAMRGALGFEIARDQRPDLILVDLHLPDLDGRDVLRMLRDEPLTSELPVAVVSADATPARIAEVRTLGADYYLTKPIDIHELIAIVDHHLEHRQAAHGEPG